MNVLIRITRIIHGHSTVYNSHLKVALQHSKQMSKLYTGICEGRVRSDADAKNLLYGHATSSSKYYEVKRRLKSRLLDCLFFLRGPNGQFTDISSVYYNSAKTLLASRIMATRNDSLTAGILAESIVKLSDQYDFTDITFLLSKQLIAYYSMIKPNAIKYQNYCALLKKCQRNLHAETAAELAYFDVNMLYSGSHRTPHQNTIDEIQKNHDHVLIKFKDVKTRQFIRAYYSYNIIVAEINCKNDSAYALYRIAKKQLQEKAYNPRGSIFTLDLRAVSILIKLRRYEEAQEIAAAQSKAWDRNELKWHIMAIYYFILSCHSRNYPLAFQIVQDAVSSKMFKILPENTKQLWYINEAFARFFLHCGEVQLNEEEKSQLKKFRIYKFLNEVPIYAKDKGGMNISILIIQVLFFTWEKKYRKVQSRIDSLSRYCKKYLTDSDTYRSHCFIKMLIELAKADFNPIRGQRYAKKYHDKLLAMPLSNSRQAIEVEIVPYEHLWDMILEMCGRNGRVSKSVRSPGM